MEVVIQSVRDSRDRSVGKWDSDNLPTNAGSRSWKLIRMGSYYDDVLVAMEDQSIFCEGIEAR